MKIYVDSKIGTATIQYYIANITVPSLTNVLIALQFFIIWSLNKSVKALILQPLLYSLYFIFFESLSHL